jgi:adenylate kinase family enzyme
MELRRFGGRLGDEMKINLKKYKKIFITGGPGTGKTTLAKKLSELIKIKYYRADRLAYSRDFQKKYSDKEKTKKLKELVKKKKWIIEGVYMDWMKEAYKSADLIIIIDLPKRIILPRAYKRSKKLMKETDKHTHKDMIYLLKKANKYRKQNHKKFIDLIELKNKDYIILKNKRQIKNILNTPRRS